MTHLALPTMQGSLSCSGTPHGMAALVCPGALCLTGQYIIQTPVHTQGDTGRLNLHGVCPSTSWGPGSAKPFLFF